MQRLPLLSIACRLTMAVSLMACSGGRDVTGLRPTAPPLTEADPNPVIQSISGHWEVIGSLGNLNKISANAEKRLDGTVTGEVQYEQFTPDGLSILAHATVRCLNVQENIARLAVEGDETTEAGTVHGFGILTAIDNGEGQPNPDMATNLIPVASGETRALSHCGEVPVVPDSRALPVQRGNVQVRS